MVKDILEQSRLKQEEVMKFYKLVVGEGNYYTLETATNMVYSSGLTHRKRIKLVNFLKEIEIYGSIYEAKKVYMQHTKGRAAADEFSKNLSQLRRQGINPICMPKEWGLSYPENIYDKIEAVFTT